MVDDDILVNSVCGSLAIEGMPVPDSTKLIMRDCVNGKRTFDDAVSMIVAQHLGDINEQI